MFVRIDSDNKVFQKRSGNRATIMDGEIEVPDSLEPNIGDTLTMEEQEDESIKFTVTPKVPKPVLEQVDINELEKRTRASEDAILQLMTMNL